MKKLRKAAADGDREAQRTLGAFVAKYSTDDDTTEDEPLILDQEIEDELESEDPDFRDEVARMTDEDLRRHVLVTRRLTTRMWMRMRGSGGASR